MGKKLDLSGLTEQEAEHVLAVVQRDMKLRKKEEERLSEMRQELDEEGSRCSLLLRQEHFNQRCCMRCFSPFGFLLKRKRPCGDCGYNVCRGCSSYSKEEHAWLCNACNKSRLLRTQSLEWYYCNVRRRFKRFGGAKVLKTLYRKLTVDQRPPLELAGASVYEESMGNEGSVSDSTFYRQSKEYSISETLHVALRVAEEAVEDAIAKAEEHCDSLKKNEAHYLRENKEELIEELATSIVQKIMSHRRKVELPTQDSEGASPPLSQQSTLPSQAHLKATESLWRSRSAFSLTSTGEEAADGDLGFDAWGWAQAAVRDYSSLKRDTGSSLASWKSVDQLDNACVSSVLQSPDGNWIALQSKQRPHLLTTGKSLVFSSLERESGAVSAYDDMGSGSEGDAVGGGILLEIRRKMSQRESERTDASDPHADSETTTQGSPPKYSRQLMSSLRRKVRQQRSSHPLDAARSLPLDSSVQPEDGQGDRVRRSRRRRKTKREAEDQLEQSSSAPEYNNFLLKAMRRKSVKEESPAAVSHAAPHSVSLISGTLESATASPDAAGLEAVDLQQKLNAKLSSHAKGKDLSSPTGELDEKPAEAGGETSGHICGQLEKAGGVDEMENVLKEQPKDMMNGGGNMAERDIQSEGVKWEHLSPLGVENEGLLKKYQERQMDVQANRLDPTQHQEPTEKVRGTVRETIRKMDAEVDPDRVRMMAQRLSVSGRDRHVGGEAEKLAEREGDEESQGDPEEREQTDGGKWGQVDMEKLGLSEEVETAGQIQMEAKMDGGRQTEGEEERLGKMKHGECFHREGERHAEIGDHELERWVGLEDERQWESEEMRRSKLEAERHMESEEEGQPETEHLEESLGQNSGKAKIEMSPGNKEEEFLAEEEERSEEIERRERLGKKGKKIEEDEMEAKWTIKEGSPSALDHMSAEDVHRKYSAASLCSITTEVLRVLNATEDLIEEVEGKPRPPDTPIDSASADGATDVPASHGDSRLDEHLLTLEENVYLAAGAVFRLEGELRELEECARDIGRDSTDEELVHLEEQVANAAVHVQQSDLQVSGIAARISALKSAGLNVAHSTQQPGSRSQPKMVSRLPHTLTFTGRSATFPSLGLQPQTIDTSRQQRRKLPTPPH